LISQQTNIVSSEVLRAINRTSFASIWRHRRPHELTGCALGLRNPSAKCLSWGDFGNTLLATKISPPKGVLKMIFLFSRWDMLVPWRLKSNLPRCKVSKKFASMRSIWKVKLFLDSAFIDNYQCDMCACSRGGGRDQGPEKVSKSAR